LGFNVIEHFHINIIKTRLDALGLAVGPWLQHLKTLIFANADPGTQIEVPRKTTDNKMVTLTLGSLIDDIVRITPGQKIAYITDVVYSKSNEEKIIQLAEKADQLFIEAAFLESEHHIARQKHHLTAKQAGSIAHKAGAKQVIVFHHSPRYLGQRHLLVEEAEQAFASPCV
jgi:ribonuclease Z